MNYRNIYLYIIKNKINYDLIYLNKKKYIWWNYLINIYLLDNFIIYINWQKKFCKQNGLKILLLQNWYKYGIKYNLILKLFKK